MTTISLPRRRLLQGTAAAIALPSAFGALAQAPARQFRIGNQKGLLNILKGRGTLEKRLAPLAYVGATVPRPQSEAVLVPKGSAIKTVAELKGRKIALNKGSNVHYFIVKLFEKHGLSYADLNLVYLPPADARAAFEKGSIDAWVIWDPFLAAAEKTLEARVLADATGVVGNRAYYFSSLDYAAKNADVVAIAIEELNKVDAWGSANRGELATELAALWGLPKPVSDLTVARTAYGTTPITKAILGEQQKIADTFFELKLIPKKINVLEAATGIA